MKAVAIIIAALAAKAGIAYIAYLAMLHNITYGGWFVLMAVLYVLFDETKVSNNSDVLVHW